MPTPRQHASHAQRQAVYRQRLAARARQEKEAKGLPPLPSIGRIPGYRRWGAMSRHALYLLETMEEEMRAYYDERSDAWQESEKGEGFEEKIEAVGAATSAVEEVWHQAG